MSLKLAIEAQLPMVAVQTRDTLNFHTILLSLTGRHAVSFNGNSPIQPDTLYTYIWNPKSEPPLLQLYEKLVAMESTLVIINPTSIKEPMFDAGEAPVPKELLLEFMMEVVGDEGKAKELLRGLGGCTLKEAAELARLTMARDGSLTLAGVVDTRKSTFQGSNGLTHIDTHQSYYEPSEQLQSWIAKEKHFFLNSPDARLVPRGLLFDGPPGVGKTSGAKWLAAQLGVPLYRMDIGGAKGKYVGQSEGNLLSNLARIDQEEPCVVLLDEAEKIFGSGEHGDGGTTTTMLSQLLWWLAEHRSRVLTLMTTNNVKKLPKELWREGRIDQMMWFGGLEFAPAVKFFRNVVKTFDVEVSEKIAAQLVERVMAQSGLADTKPAAVAHSALTEAAHEYVKSLQLARIGAE